MIYIFGWVSLLLGLGASRWRGSVPRALTLASILVVASIAILRGAVGTDTESYEYWAGAVRAGMGTPAEPGFTALLYSLTWLFDSDQWAVRGVSLVYALLLLVAYRRGDEDERFLLCAFILPAFFFLHTMNVLRLGIASAILLLAVQCARRDQLGRYWLLGACAVSFHYTSATALIYLWLLNRDGRGLKSATLSVLAFVGAATLLSLNLEWIDQKAQGYSYLQAPDELSGLSQVVILLLLFASAASLRLGYFTKAKLIGISGVLATSGWLLARQSYAGLRFLDLLVFMFPLAMLVALANAKLSLERIAKMFLLLAAIASAGAQYRGFVLGEGTGATPFLPYQSIFADN